MIGSPYEAHPIRHKDFSLRAASFTDDTVLTVAVAKAVFDGEDYARSIKRFAQAYYKKMPEAVVSGVRRSMTPDLLQVVDRFCQAYPCCLSQSR